MIDFMDNSDWQGVSVLLFLINQNFFNEISNFVCHLAAAKKQSDKSEGDFMANYCCCLYRQMALLPAGEGHS